MECVSVESEQVQRFKLTAHQCGKVLEISSHKQRRLVREQNGK